MITKVLDLIMNSTTYSNREQLRRIVQKHFDYRTCTVLMEHDKPIGYARWNYITPEIVHVIDFRI